MPRLETVIIADDLTGALDAVAPFAAVGMDCVVATSPDGLSAAMAHASQVLSINLGTRERGSVKAQAIAGTAALAAQRLAGPETVWLKKIDSRLKGQIAAEVAGVIGVIGPASILMCPAIPDLGRVVVGGNLEGEGVATPIPVALRLPGGIDVATPDVRSDDDLDRVVQALGSGTLFVGARGLAAALARRQRPGRRSAAVPMPEGPVGFCIGSRDPITLAQADILRKTGEMPCVAAPDGIVPLQPATGEVLLQATQGSGATAAQVAVRLADGIIGYLKGLRTLVVSGGETAGALLRAADIGVLRVVGEVQPGLPLCHAVEVPGFPALVTKSGGFGRPDTLLRLWQAAHSKEGQPCR